MAGAINHNIKIKGGLFKNYDILYFFLLSLSNYILVMDKWLCIKFLISFLSYNYVDVYIDIYVEQFDSIDLYYYVKCTFDMTICSNYASLFLKVGNSGITNRTWLRKRPHMCLDEQF